MKQIKLLFILMVLPFIGCQNDKCDELGVYTEVEHIYTQRTDGSYQVNILENNKGTMGYCQCWNLKNEKDSIWENRINEANPILQEVMLRNPNEYNCF